MPIYEFYCPDNHKIYQFYAKTLAQGRTAPPCPDNPAYRMQKMISAFALGGRRKESDGAPPPPDAGGADAAEEARMEASLAAMESEFAGVDENDPKAVGRMMRRMAEISGEKIEGEMEEVVRKLEEGADPDSIEERLGGDLNDPAGGEEGGSASEAKEAKRRRRRSLPPRRDPRLYDYP